MEHPRKVKKVVEKRKNSQKPSSAAACKISACRWSSAAAKPLSQQLIPQHSRSVAAQQLPWRAKCPGMQRSRINAVELQKLKKTQSHQLSQKATVAASLKLQKVPSHIAEVAKEGAKCPKRSSATKCSLVAKVKTLSKPSQ